MMDEKISRGNVATCFAIDMAVSALPFSPTQLRVVTVIPTVVDAGVHDATMEALFDIALLSAGSFFKTASKTPLLDARLLCFTT
jgi:hypothetical protein